MILNTYILLVIMYNFSSFKRQHTFQYRLEESQRIKSKHRDRIPIICEKSTAQHSLPNIDKHKILVNFGVV